jgi:threonine dehydrogenase-like Zn-dependent dehydrogenase
VTTTASVLALTGSEGVDHAVDYTGSPEVLRFLGSAMRLGGSIVISSEQGREPVPFTAADLIRLELNLLGIRGARMNDMLTVLKLLGTGRIQTRVAARFPLARVGEAHELLVNSPDLVGRIVVLPWA